MTMTCFLDLPDLSVGIFVSNVNSLSLISRLNESEVICHDFSTVFSNIKQDYVFRGAWERYINSTKGLLNTCKIQLRKKNKCKRLFSTISELTEAKQQVEKEHFSSIHQRLEETLHFHSEMGNNNSISHFPTKQKQLLVRTGVQDGKGTDANIQVILHDKSGRKTKPISLDCKFRNDFESGQTDNFPIDLR